MRPTSPKQFPLFLLFSLLFSLFGNTAFAGIETNTVKPNVLWHNSATGAVKFMPINAMTPEATISIKDSSNTNLIPKGIADFDGDGIKDILVHNKNSGMTRAWIMSGTNDVVDNIALLESSNTNLIVAGVGDFDSDGDTDIATFNANSGALIIWVMDGITKQRNETVLRGANLNLIPEGVGDMDNDGIPDIVLRNNNSGAVRVWTMNNNFTRKANLYLTGSSNTNLELRGVMDINEDGNNDILNYNTNTGMLRTWLMDGSMGIIENTTIVQDADLAWSVRKGYGEVQLIPELPQELMDSITFMYSEEGLAYDVYMNIYKIQAVSQLESIATNSETKHIAEVNKLAIKYDLNITKYPDTDHPYSTDDLDRYGSGEYPVEPLQELYNLLYDKGIQSRRDALEVGCMVEVVDVDDLDHYIAQAIAANASDVLDTFNFLRNGSYSHYWTFDNGLKRMGVEDGCCSLEPALGQNFCHPEYPNNVTSNK